MIYRQKQGWSLSWVCSHFYKRSGHVFAPFLFFLSTITPWFAVDYPPIWFFQETPLPSHFANRPVVVRRWKVFGHSKRARHSRQKILWSMCRKHRKCRGRWQNSFFGQYFPPVTSPKTIWVTSCLLKRVLFHSAVGILSALIIATLRVLSVLSHSLHLWLFTIDFFTCTEAFSHV